MKILIILILGITVLFGSIDINSASVEKLSSLVGIGESKAEAIVAYRKEHCFKNIDELANVKGIGEKTVEKNKENMQAGACEK